MNFYPTPNAKYEHVFVVARFDGLDHSVMEDNVTLVATYFRQGEAERECDRLNALSTSHYVVLLSRLKGER